MISHDVTGKLSFNQSVRGGIEPSGTTIEVRVNVDGFFDAASGVGGAGQSGEPLALERIADTLVQHFDRDRLRTVLDHIVRLRQML